MQRALAESRRPLRYGTWAHASRPRNPSATSGSQVPAAAPDSPPMRARAFILGSSARWARSTKLPLGVSNRTFANGIACKLLRVLSLADWCWLMTNEIAERIDFGMQLTW